MKILIVDDEFNARRVIRKMLSDHYDNLNFLNDATSVEEAIEIIKEEEPDIVFMDIQLGDKKSFDVFESTSIKGELIFVTAYDNYTKEAFDLNALNYIVKPIQRNKLYSTFERAMTLIEREGATSQPSNSDVKINKILLPCSGSQTVISVDEIIYAKADGAYCRIFFNNNKSVLIVKPLVFIEKKLEKYPYIMRIHKSYLLNFKKVKKVASDLSNINIDSNVMLPISRQKKQEVKKILDDFFY